jgi:putative membrane protein
MARDPGQNQQATKTEQLAPTVSCAPSAELVRREIGARRRAMATLPYVLMAALGAILWWLDRYRAASVPAWAPYDFDWTYFLATALGACWYLRGLALTNRAERPTIWRTTLYFLGVVVIYAVLQTRFEYMAQHMFFLNRIQHVIMHHLGPFLIALAWPGATIARGMPAWLKRLVTARPVLIARDIIQQPFLAAVLFVGLIALWLTPSVHFVAMIDPDLYRVMNWTMVGDGLLFWFLVLDPRPYPAAPISHAARIIASVLVMFPQIAIGAAIALANRDIYGFYDWCGRLLPSICAIDDQIYGGLIVWIPPAMMSVAGMLLALNMLRLSEEAKDKERNDEAEYGAVFSASWTGR